MEHALQQVAVYDLVIGTVYVESLSIDHQLGHLGEVFRDFPIYIVAGKCGDRLAKLGFDHHDPGLAEVVLVLVYVAATAALSVRPALLLWMASSVKSTSGFRPSCMKIQVSPQLSISLPSMVMVITDDRS